uniref:Helo_like_N domain-containing protein n=1 Tax=Rhabditophanes sp. KR3021 TaxID=114890 RepID=A0AC35UF14_9BILA
MNNKLAIEIIGSKLNLTKAIEATVNCTNTMPDPILNPPTCEALKNQSGVLYSIYSALHGIKGHLQYRLSRALYTNPKNYTRINIIREYIKQKIEEIANVYLEAKNLQRESDKCFKERKCTDATKVFRDLSGIQENINSALDELDARIESGNEIGFFTTLKSYYVNSFNQTAFTTQIQSAEATKNTECVTNDSSFDF